MKFSKIVALAMTLAMLATLVACGGAAPEASSAASSAAVESSAASSTEEPPAAGEIVIGFASGIVEGTPGRAAYFYPIVDQFQNENPNVKIDIKAVGHDDYQVKIATQIAAKDVDDIFQYKGGMLNEVVKNNLAMPLTDVFKDDPDWFNEYYPGVFNDMTKNDVIYGFPVEFVFTTLLYYNKDIFAECGFEKPSEDWDEFLAQCDAIREKGYMPIVMGNKDGWPFESCTFSQFANSITGTEWFDNIKHKKGGAFTDPEFIAALGKVIELRDRQVFNPDINTLDYSLGIELYNQKKGAMMTDGTWTLATIMDTSPDDVKNATEITFMPKVKDGKGDIKDICGGAGWAYGIKAGTEGEKLEMALKFMKMFNGSYSADTALKNGHFGPAQIPGFDAANYDPLVQRYFTSIMDQYKEPVQCYSVHLPTNLINVFYSGLQDFWADNVTAEEYAAELQSEYERSDMD